MQWVEAIGNLYHLNGRRLAAVEYEQSYLEADGKLREAVDQMAEDTEQQLAAADLHPGSRKALESLKRHWKGLTVFVDYPDVPMDNNAAERLQRGPAVARKIYYGSGSVWSGHFAATMFTILQTLLLWEINPRLWLTWYLESCALSGGKPPADPKSFLPWNMPDKQRDALTFSHPFHDTS